MKQMITSNFHGNGKSKRQKKKIERFNLFLQMNTGDDIMFFGITTISQTKVLTF